MKKIRLVVVGLLGAAALALGGCVPPVSLAPPLIYGAAVVGTTLTVSPGQWLLSGQISYEWQSCAPNLTGCAVKGTGTSYPLTTSDLGQRIRVKVTNKNEFGTQVAYTAPTAVVSGPLTERVSVASDETQGDGASWIAAGVSADGRYAIFNTAASNFGPGTGGGSDRHGILRDRVAGTTTAVWTLVSATPKEAFVTSMSPDGRFIAFSSPDQIVAEDTNTRTDAYLLDRQGGVSLVSKASDGTLANHDDQYSMDVQVSDDGRYVAFLSSASNLVAGDTNDAQDVFVHDRQTAQTTRATVASNGDEADGGVPGPGFETSEWGTISGNGRYVVFHSVSDNLAPHVPGATDVYVHDRVTGETEIVSVSQDGLVTGGSLPSISADGRYVAFVGPDLVPGDTNGVADIYVTDRVLDSIERVSVATDGTQGDGHSLMLSSNQTISNDGRYVTFWSLATTLVDADVNGASDAFVRDRSTDTTERVSVSTAGAEANSYTQSVVGSPSGRYVLFSSNASNLVSGDTNGVNDVFIRDRGA